MMALSSKYLCDPVRDSLIIKRLKGQASTFVILPTLRHKSYDIMSQSDNILHKMPAVTGNAAPL